MTYGVVDLFAGPGGLAEGFAQVRRPDGTRPFSIELSVEMEESAHRTLTLRSFLRQFGDQYPEEYYSCLNEGRKLPDWSQLYPDEWNRAEDEAVRLELGKAPRDVVNERLDRVKDKFGDRTVLIGGPPCQAYSLVGRARNLGIKNYVAEEDHRHYLYQEYIRILTYLKPAVFVMENVKGILSSRVGGTKIFEKILADLQAIEVGGAGYQLVALRAEGATGQNGRPLPKDFVVRAEEYGVPQARHRVIVVGIRPDMASQHDFQAIHAGLLNRKPNANVADVLNGMPKLRSGLSREADSPEQWRDALQEAAGLVVQYLADAGDTELYNAALHYAAETRCGNVPTERMALRSSNVGEGRASELMDWLLRPELSVVPNHETRGHMRSDLARYFFAAVFTSVEGRSPKAPEYPAGLAPLHENWRSGKFSDRFRVQRWDFPSSTVTSHISKDGHYFIHPDPVQCRSLTVREAARLQTFPDDYLFLGNRTQQYVQVGNAVPPYLAYQIGKVVLDLVEATLRPRVAGLREEQATYL